MQRKSSLTLTFLAIIPIALCSTLAHAQSGAKAESGSQSKMSSQSKANSHSQMSAGQKFSRLVTVDSQQSFDKTYETLKQTIESKGLKVLAEIDHAENAKMAEMELPPTKVILFGNPKMGTPLMKADQSMALDLPQRIAVYEDTQGKVHLCYNNPKVIAKEHQLASQNQIIGKISKALKMLTSKAAGGSVQ